MVGGGERWFGMGGWEHHVSGASAAKIDEKNRRQKPARHPLKSHQTLLVHLYLPKKKSVLFVGTITD